MAPVSTTEKPPPISAYDEIIQIKIGSNPSKIFSVHKGILIFYSGYFEGALRHTSTFTEARDGIFWLPDEEIYIWQHFVAFLYSRNIELCSFFDLNLKMLCRLWVLADRREVPLLMNKCIDAIKDEVLKHWCTPVEMLPYVYENTAPGAALRRFVLLLSARAGNPSAKASPFDASMSQHLNEESLRDLCQLLWGIEAGRAWVRKIELERLETCPEYHNHGSNQEKKCRET